MSKLKQNMSAIRAVVIGVMVAPALFVLWNAHANSSNRVGTEMVVPARSNPILRDRASDLSPRRCFALGMIETGNNDREIGGAGEVSRYQIMPAVWRNYSRSGDYQNPRASLEVARRHWGYLHDYFKERTGREPDDFDMYVLWNTRFGYYASRGFTPARLQPVVRDRAARFVNLVERGDDSSRQSLAAR
jgi:hypothetical protein